MRGGAKRCDRRARCRRACETARGAAEGPSDAAETARGAAEGPSESDAAGTARRRDTAASRMAVL